MNNLTNLFWNEHFRNKDIKVMSKIKQKVYNWLNCDNFGGFGVDGNIYWIEKTCSLAKLPNYIYNYIKSWAKRKGFIYLYDLPTKEA